jgi:hypothetical protein
MIQVQPKTPTIFEVFNYTYNVLETRFENYERDVLPSRLKIRDKLVYAKNKKGLYTTPDERLEVESWSAPQYSPYDKLKSSGAKRQMKVKHQYSIIMALQKDANGIYSMQSKVIWRVGSYKRMKYPPQRLIKQIYKETREALKKKYDDDPDLVREAIDKIKKHAIYESVGDYAAQVLGINLDNYHRNYWLQARYLCLFGPLTNPEINKNPRDKHIRFPFACKHFLGLILFLVKKGIIKK